MKQPKVTVMMLAALAQGCGARSAEAPVEVLASGQPPNEGICGTDEGFERCPNGPALVQRYESLPRTYSGKECVYEGGMYRSRVRIQVPRLRPGSHDKDNLTLATFSSTETDYMEIYLIRNGQTVMTAYMQDDQIIGPEFAAYEDGSVESTLVLATDPELMKHLVAIGSGCGGEPSPGVQFNSRCNTCKGLKVALIVSVAALGGIVAGALGAGVVGAIAVETGAVAIAQSVDEWLSCDKTCKVGQCESPFNQCLDSTSHDDATGIARCNAAKAMCCGAQGGRCITCTQPGHRSKAGAHCCCD